jgi:Raf kinase inhibitor-like YbhB/YbcL family protein
MRIQRLGFGGLVLSLGLVLWGCSSDDSSNSTGTAGSNNSSGGSNASGGSQGTGGEGTGGAATGGSSTGGSATGGSSTGGSSTGGSSGSGGSGVTDGGGKLDAAVGLDAAGAGDGGPFALTSSAYTEGMTIPAANTCAGANTSPPLSWTAGPSGTKSYTLIFTDKSNMLVHWALWDLPPTTMSLPASLPTGSPLTAYGGAQQVSISGAKYAGPCPGGNVHTYQFDLYAVDVDKLPGLPNKPVQADVVKAVMMHKLGVASLSGMAKTN